MSHRLVLESAQSLLLIHRYTCALITSIDRSGRVSTVPMFHNPPARAASEWQAVKGTHNSTDPTGLMDNLALASPQAMVLLPPEFGACMHTVHSATTRCSS